MTDQDFDYIRKLLRERSAIVLEAGKQYLVESRLAPLVRELKLDSIGDLVAPAALTTFNGLQQQVVEAMVTTETSFFRDHHPFEALRKAVIPELGPQTPERAAPEHLVRGLLHRAGAVQRCPVAPGAFPRAGRVEGHHPGHRPLAGRAGPRGKGATPRSRSTAVCPRRCW